MTNKNENKAGFSQVLPDPATIPLRGTILHLWLPSRTEALQLARQPSVDYLKKTGRGVVLESRLRPSNWEVREILGHLPVLQEIQRLKFDSNDRRK